jgi:hypothetical protein
VSFSQRRALNRGAEFFLVVFFIFFLCSLSSLSATAKKRDIPAFLKDIYTEIVQLGKYPGYDFFERQFFVGEDEDDTNKDVHCVIMIQDISGSERMTIQLTYMERVQRDPVIGIAREVRNIKCSFDRGNPDLLLSDFSEPEMNNLLPDILNAIRDKKRLMQLKIP